MGAPRGTLSERLWRRVNVLGPVPEHAPELGPCSVWLGTTDEDGYGKIKRPDGSLARTHVVAWEEANGPVPDGLEIDHLCRNTSCCRPSHLEAVTHEENVRRAALVLRPTCPKGHPYEGKHARSGRQAGTRRCLICHRDEQRDYRRRKREAA